MSSQQNIARAPARARARVLGRKLNHSRCGPERARRRCGGSAETPPSCMPPMVTPLANVGGLARRPAVRRRRCRPPPRAFCLWGSTGARQHVYASQSWLQRPQTLMNNPTHRLLKKKFAQEQRRQRKKGAPRPRAHLHAGGPNRALPSPRKRLDAGARTCRSSTCIAKTSYKTAEAFPWPARGPFLREDACACHGLAPSPRLPFCAALRYCSAQHPRP